MRPIAGRIKQLPSDWAGSLITSDDPSLAAAVLALLPVGFTWPRTSLCMPVRSYRTLSPLPTQLPGLAVYFLLHLPADRSGLLLATTVPCGVRTFLDHRLPTCVAVRCAAITRLTHSRGLSLRRNDMLRKKPVLYVALGGFYLGQRIGGGGIGTLGTLSLIHI